MSTPRAATFHTYLITPKYVLGSDSFFLSASDYIEACEKAVARCRKEGWSGEWEVYKLEGGLVVNENTNEETKS